MSVCVLCITKRNEEGNTKSYYCGGCPMYKYKCFEITMVKKRKETENLLKNHFNDVTCEFP